MRDFEHTHSVYEPPIVGQPPRRIPSLSQRVVRNIRKSRPPLLLCAVLLVALCATLVTLAR